MPISQNQSLQNRNFRLIAMILIGGGLLVIGVVSYVLLTSNSVISEKVRLDANTLAIVEFPAPDLELQDIYGDPVSLRDYHGQVVLVNNWATWCPPCRQEMPILDEYYRDHQHQEFVIVAIDAGDPASMVADFVHHYEMSFPVWLDPSSPALNSFRNNYLPSSYLIDKGGRVILVWSGAVTYASLEHNVTPLLME